MSEANYSKTVCAVCGVRVEYPSEAEGQTAPCPECGNEVMLLRKDESCVDKTAKRATGSKNLSYGGTPPAWFVDSRPKMPIRNFMVHLGSSIKTARQMARPIHVALGLVLFVLLCIPFGLILVANRFDGVENIWWSSTTQEELKLTTVFVVGAVLLIGIGKFLAWKPVRKFVVPPLMVIGVLFGGIVIMMALIGIGKSLFDFKPLHQPFALLMSLVFFCIAVVGYFTPAIIAFKRGKKDWVAIGALNLLLGWTFLGWVVAFIWSLKSD